jgi:hypothetical protein
MARLAPKATILLTFLIRARSFAKDDFVTGGFRLLFQLSHHGSHPVQQGCGHPGVTESLRPFPEVVSRSFNIFNKNKYIYFWNSFWYDCANRGSPE